MKQYPLELQNIGTDIYTLISKGHQDIDNFTELVKINYPTWFRLMGKARHTYFKRAGERLYECGLSVRGSFPATLITEGKDE